MEMEKRIIEEAVEIREEGDQQFISGLGIVFNKESKDLGGFREVITPDALFEADMTDVIVRAEHTNDYVLGRTPKTAELMIDEDGVRYRVLKPNTTAGNDMAEYIKRGDLRGSSFAFSGVTDKWEERNDGTILRTITKIDKIHDIGPVFNPAYASTDFKVAIRAMEEWREEEKKKAEKPEEKPAEEVKPRTGLSLARKVRLEKLRG